MNIAALRRTVPAALAATIALSAAVAPCAPATAYADAHGSTELTLRQVDNPFDTGANQHLSINEGGSLALRGDITGGFGDVSYQWFVSTDSGNQWVKVKDGSETSIDGATGSTYTATDDDAGYELVCKVSSTDDICQGTISGATGAVKKIQAFAVYSADDGSLNFYKRAEVPKQGTIYLGKRATAVYTGLENMTSAPGWMLNYSKDIKTAIVYDDGISPTDTGFWFAQLRNMKTADVSKLDMSKCKTIGCMFTNCTSLTSLDLSTWDNSAVTSMKDVFSMMDSLNEVSLGSKFKFVGTSPFLPDQTGHVAGADGKWYDTDGNGYTPADIPSNKAMTYYASKDLLPKAFAVYSAPADDDYDDDDGASLNFYKRSGVPAVGEQFEGKTVTAVYTGIEENTYTRTSQPWENYQSEIKTATVVDEGITPISTAYWFIYCDRLTSCDLNKLDTSNLTNMSDMFGKCRRLTSVGDLSGWNTSSVTNMSRMFYGCSKLSVDCSTWDVSKVTDHVWFNEMARGVTVPLAWQTSSDESVDDSAIATLCEEQGNGDALSVPSENDNDEATSKTNGKASADSETEGSNTASADDAGAKEEEAPGDIVQEEPAAA